MCAVRTCIVVSKVRTFLFSLLFVDQVCAGRDREREREIRHKKTNGDRDITV